MKTRLEAANDFITQTITTTPLTAAPHFHFSPQVGWINDPNGFSYYNGKYQLFYQYYPYDTVWNNMHWGHTSTVDFLTWEHHPVALANDKHYDANGCFSGSAIEKDGKLYLMYTGHTDPNLLHKMDESQVKQVQCIAVSEDGINFEKIAQNPVINEQQLPDHYLICDFRDPKVWQHENKYYCVIAARNNQRRGEILMFVSDDLINWSFHSPILQTTFEENTLLECPDYFQVNGQDMMLYSIMPCDPQYIEQVERRVCYAIGKLDYVSGKFIVEHEGLLDYGHSFYAPQTTEGKDGEQLLIGWMQSWNQSAPPKDFTFNGMMSLPRQLSIEKNKLLQYPLTSTLQAFKEVESYMDIKLTSEKQLHLKSIKTGQLELSFPALDHKQGTVMIQLQHTEQSGTYCKIDFEQATISIYSDYSESKQKIIPFTKDKLLELNIFFDLYSVEMFINKGEQVFTTTSYLDKGDAISISSSDDVALNKIKLLQFTL